MISYTVRNVNEALPLGLQLFRSTAGLRKVNPRGAERVELTQPYCTTYLRPQERVLFNPVRDANPFFHLMDALWMLARRNDVAWLQQWLPRISEYSDDGKTFHGAYGERFDVAQQLEHVIDRLRDEPESTRCVISMWQPARDANYEGGDMPCNTTAYFQLREHTLDLTVCNRSNDLVWGAYGANAVQWSMLLEYVAACVDAEVGSYVQFSNNTHVYPKNEATARCISLITDPQSYDPYDAQQVKFYPMYADRYPDGGTEFKQVWDDDLEIFMHQTDPDNFKVRPEKFIDPWFAHVAAPLATAHYAYRQGDLSAALILANYCRATDWRMASNEWLRRRAAKRGNGEGTEAA